MQVAVLVLAYRYPLGIKALSRFFSGDPRFSLFVHVDQKVDIKPFIDNAESSVLMLKDRVSVFWRGWTMIEATMRLITEARQRRVFDRYLLISDDSIPLVNLQTLSRMMENSPNFVQLAPTPGRSWRYERFFMFDSAPTQLRFTPNREFNDDAIMRFERMITLRRRGKKPIKNYFQGSQWWGLSAKNIDTIIASWNEDKWLRESFEFSDAPDESYFHQILGPTGNINVNPLMWVDWNADNPPKTFTSINELVAIPRKNHLFARKINLTENELLKWIENL